MRDIDRLSVLIISDVMAKCNSSATAMEGIIEDLNDSDIDVIYEHEPEGIFGCTRIMSAGMDAVVVDWSMPDADKIISDIRGMDGNITIFLMTVPEALSDLPLDTISKVDEFLWIEGDSPSFMAGRIAAACRRYRKDLLPPMFGSLVNFSEDYEYSWHTPGHTAGAAFLKAPVGRLFYDFFGEQLFRSDLSISVGELGSLLDHSGPIGEAERYASKVFGSDMTMFVTNGTSTSNRVVHMSVTPPGGIELVDRNCHKSIEHALSLNHSFPVYMLPTRNGFGIMGPIPKSNMTPDAIRKAITDSPLIVGENRSSNPDIAVVTNSTYDGICYDAAQVESILGQSTDCIHFDEAWYGYARFNPLYEGRYAMRDDDTSHGPTVFATQSTHKLLAALSQASMIHMKEGKHNVNPDIFNETFMMHASTSPQYAILASLDVSSKMMDANGHQLTQDAIEEAIRFRQMMARIKSQTEKGDWWFNVWQPEHIHIPGKLTKSRFEDVDINILSKDKDCWILRREDKWHGFTDIEDGWAMLDPIKVTVLTPGIDANGNYSEFGIPAALLVAFLDEKGIVNEKSGDYNVLFLFSMGVTNGKWGSLVSEFYDFKRSFDDNELVEDVLPKIYKAHPERYDGVRIQTLAREMHLYIMNNKQTLLGNKAASSLPRQVMPPADAYVQMVRGNVEKVKVDEAMGRVAATGIVPYPPGVPILMPGERIGDSSDPMIMYMHTLQEFDRKFPGFEHDSHGIEVIDHDYYMYCVKE
ncbi:MAG: hypothetical protein IKC93_05370 [Candidatus Methanomethylophilaceae archaeon]|nr:hypothetical protein [Candidatus Methanomethylophilaceae archaeon]